MSENVSRAIDGCLRVTELVGSTPSIELPESTTNEIQLSLEKVMRILRGFEKTATLKTRKGREAAQDIEEAAVSLEKVLSNHESGCPSEVMESLAMLERRVESLQKTIERLKRMVT